MIRSVAEKKMGSVDAVSAVGGKTARACDVCVRKRARWYCAADDAFLCQPCDDSVHSANPLARRHERLRLNTASSLKRPVDDAGAWQLSTWHRGPTKKPRTPRHRKKKQEQQSNHHPMVPELDTCSTSAVDEDEEQLLYRVPSDFDVAEFDADVEALLGKGLDGDHGFGIEELGLLFERREDVSGDCGTGRGPVKEEEEIELVVGEPFQLTFDYDSPIAYCTDHDTKVGTEMITCEGYEENINERKNMLLRLDYDAISRAWGSQGSPWINGDPPPLTTTGSSCGTEVKPCGDGGREARVSRYREKRRTRLFSKKIRYEVRKLNAEKRPRMKGRFVKRSSFPLLTK